MSGEEKVTVYVTKYALTSGIMKCTGVVVIDGDTVRINDPSGVKFYFHGDGRNWHRTWESAFARAEKMKAARIKSLKKSLAAVEALSFCAPVEEHPDG